MIAIVSQAWTRDADATEAYVEGWERFADFQRRHPGWRGRRLLVGVEDPTHITNIRFFESLADYEDLITWEGYAEGVNALGELLDLDRVPVKEVVRVAGSDDVAR